MHAGPPCRFADRLGVIAIIFPAFDVRLDVLWRDQEHCVTEDGQFTCPMMGTTAGFHGHLNRRELFEEADHLRTAKIDPQRRLVSLVVPCSVKTAFDVSIPSLYCVTGGSSGCLQLQFWHSMPWGRPPQQAQRRPA